MTEYLSSLTKHLDTVNRLVYKANLATAESLSQRRKRRDDFGNPLATPERIMSMGRRSGKRFW